MSKGAAVDSAPVGSASWLRPASPRFPKIEWFAQISQIPKSSPRLSFEIRRPTGSGRVEHLPFFNLFFGRKEGSQKGRKKKGGVRENEVFYTP